MKKLGLLFNIEWFFLPDCGKLVEGNRRSLSGKEGEELPFHQKNVGMQLKNDMKMDVKHLDAYKFLREKKVEELNSVAYFLEHKKSGARLFLLSNDDENKVFSIGFRTPPSDNTGVAHILEHSVLCLSLIHI